MLLLAPLYYWSDKRLLALLIQIDTLWIAYAIYNSHDNILWIWWFLKQISTLAGNQTPSYFLWEVIFTMAIIGLGLLLFALLIGNMQNFLQALGRRYNFHHNSCLFKCLYLYRSWLGHANPYMRNVVCNVIFSLELFLCFFFSFFFCDFLSPLWKEWIVWNTFW